VRLRFVDLGDEDIRDEQIVDDDNALVSGDGSNEFDARGVVRGGALPRCGELRGDLPRDNAGHRALGELVLLSERGEDFASEDLQEQGVNAPARFT
jgi:hypothetical protein